MNFQGLGKVENADFYLDVAFRKAKKEAGLARSSAKGPRLEKSKTIEKKRVEVTGNSIVTQLNTILKSFPSLDSMSEFYQELVKASLDYAELKQSLGGLNWAKVKVQEFTSKYIVKVVRCRDMQKINEYRREYYGRISSLVKQINKSLKVLEDARKIMKGFPSVKMGLVTVAITGFPNIGKTTLLYKITGSKPEINSYAFTTKGLNLGYAQIGGKKVQFIDTPGTLNRYNKMNSIEKQAFLALKYVSNIVIYVYDLTEPYSLQEQLKLNKLLNNLDKPLILFLSKTDLLDGKVVESFAKKNKALYKLGELEKELEKQIRLLDE